MVYGLLISLYLAVCFLLVILILIQKGKGSAGLGAISGGSQMLFGGSGGQDIFQKITWILGAIFMISSLTLSIMKSQQRYSSRYVKTSQHTVPVAPVTK